MKQFLLFTVFSKKAKSVLALFLFAFSYVTVNAQCSETGWKTFSQGETFSVGLKEDGTIWMWGQNINGILGNGSGTTTIVQHPTQIGTANDWDEISVGRWFVLAKKTNNDLYGWGDNAYGNLATGNLTDQYSPVKMAENVKSFSAGYHHSMIVKTDGTMWGVGYNDWGGLGMGTSVGYYTSWQQESSLATNWAKTFAGYYNSFGIKTNGTLWSCGTNVEGQTGTGATGGESDVFVQIGTDTNWDMVSCGVYHVLGRKTTGKLFGWGFSANGRLGIVGAGAQYFRTPQPIVADKEFGWIATSWDGSAITDFQGKLYVFGVNHGGTTGTGADTNNLAPQLINDTTDWIRVANRIGGFHFGALKADKSLRAWGTDNYYQLGNGDGTATNSSVPTKVTCTDGLGVNDVAKNNTVTLYPNPAKDVINLSSKEKISDVKIYNTAGVLIKTNVNVTDNKVNISQLKPGVYVVKINNTNDGIKFIKN